jgi:hypothetical protein
LLKQIKISYDEQLNSFLKQSKNTLNNNKVKTEISKIKNDIDEYIKLIYS